MLPFPGPGVLIDRLVVADAPALAASHSDPDNARFQGWESPLAPAEAQRFIEAQTGIEPLAPGSAVQLAIREAAGGPLAGDLYLDRSGKNPQAVEVGITLVPDFHGRGLATAAVAATLDAVFSPDVPAGPVERLVAVVDVDNVRSRRLFERLGFRLVARHVGTGQRRDGTVADEVELAMTARHWHEGPRPGPRGPGDAGAPH